jgi:hypothetical protein
MSDEIIWNIINVFCLVLSVGIVVFVFCGAFTRNMTDKYK